MKTWSQFSFGGRFAVAWPTLLIYAIPSFWVTVIYDQSRLGGAPASWWLLAILTYAATIAPLVIARFTYLKVTRIETRPVLTVLTYLAGACLRIAVTLPVGIALGLLPEEEIAYRIFSAPFHVVVWFALIAMLVSARLEHRDLMRELSGRFLELKQQAELVEAAIRSDSKAALTKVLDALEPSLNAMRKGLRAGLTANEVEKLQAGFTSTIEDVVRPLALTIANSTTAAEQSIKQLARHKKFAVPRMFLMREVNDVELIAGIALFSISIPLIHVYGWSVFWFVAAPTVLVTWVFGVFLNYIFKKRALSIAINVVILVIGYGFSSLLAISIFGAQDVRLPTVLHFQYLGLVELVLLMVVAYRLALMGQAMLEANALATNDDLEMLEAKSRLTLWIARNHLATTLHGPIQAAFQVAAIKLDSVTEITKDLAIELESSVNASLEELTAIPELEWPLFVQTCDDIVELWSGVTDVSIEIAPASKQELEGYSKSLRAALEVIREAVANAVKHGHASHIVVVLETKGSTVWLLVSNNGQPLKDDSQSGFGQQMLSELSLNWEITNSQGLVDLKVVLPLVK